MSGRFTIADHGLVSYVRSLSFSWHYPRHSAICRGSARGMSRNDCPDKDHGKLHGNPTYPYP